MSQIFETHPSNVQSATASRVGFLRSTYIHLSGAILVFAALQYAIQAIEIASIPIAAIISGILFSNQLVAFAVLIGFIVISNIARNWSMSDISYMMQYTGLGLYTVIEVLFFAPIIYLFVQNDPQLLLLAIGGTIVVSILLTLMAFTTGTNYSFLRGFLSVGGLIALGVILLSFIIPALASSFIFLGFMLIFASAAILYQTSRVIHDYPDDKYVAAALALFASIMLLFWYILRTMLRLTSR